MARAATIIRWPLLGYQPSMAALVRPGPVHCPACGRRWFTWWPRPGSTGAIHWEDTCKKCGILADLTLLV